MEYKTLIELYQSDGGLQKEFPDMMGKGISGEWTLNDWYNRYGKVDYPNVTLVQPGDPRLKTPADTISADTISADTTPADTASPADKGFIGPLEEGQARSPLDPGQKMARFGTDPTPDDPTTDQNTVWLYDSETKQYRPVESPEALQALLKTSTVAEAFKHVQVMPFSVTKTPEWQGSFISSKDSIKKDGRIPESSTVIPGTEADTAIETYGRERVSDDAEELAGNMIGAILTSARQKGDISDKVFKENLLENPKQLAKYVTAILYGGYDIPRHIYADLKAKTLVEQGQSEYADFKAFDEEIKLDEWINSEEGQKFTNDQNIVVPEGVLNIDVDMFSNPIFQIPGSAFSTIVKPIDIDSPEFKAEAEEIQASYYDIMTQKAEAETEQAKAIADNNWQIFKKNLEKKYDLQLSDNAKTAWGQLQELFTGSQQAGLAGTGLEREVKDRYLKELRERDDLLRESEMDEKEMEERSKLLKSGSSADIAEFAAANPEKAQEWGLIPSEEQKQWFSKENLKSLYPDMSDTEIDTIANMVIDPETGHYRSEMYQNLYSNKYDLGEQKKSYQWEKLYQKKLDEEKKAYEPYTKQNPFSSFYDKEAIPHEYKEETEPGITPFTPDIESDTPVSQQAMRDMVQKEAATPAQQVASSSQQIAPSQSGLEKIRSVFGAGWNPSATFKDSKDYLGAVRVKGAHDVYGIGEKDPYKFTAETYAKRFGGPGQEGIVGEISRAQAKKFGISGY
jgi:ribosomal protein S24E